MKNIILFPISIFLIFSSFVLINPIQDSKSVNEEGIKFFSGSWNEAKAVAKKENKLIFLDVYASWCVPCKKLKKFSFSNEDVGKFYNQHFINFSIDGEKGEGVKVAKQYKLVGYPSLYFIDTAGNIVKYFGGYLGPEQLLALGQSSSK